MTFGKVLSPTKTLVGNAFKLSLNTQRAIISGGQFTAYNMTHMTFDPNIPVGYYFKNDGPGIERNEGWHDSGGDYAKKIAIPAFTSFILGSQFPRLGTLGGEVVTIEKGSITVNGVSLTVVNSQINKFSVAIIPYTLEHTTFRNLQVNDKVNLEFDVIGKYVKRLTEVK
mgnify:CR=1 FL=1